MRSALCAMWRGTYRSILVRSYTVSGIYRYLIYIIESCITIRNHFKKKILAFDTNMTDMWRVHCSWILTLIRFLVTLVYYFETCARNEKGCLYMFTPYIYYIYLYNIKDQFFAFTPSSQCRRVFTRIHFIAPLQKKRKRTNKRKNKRNKKRNDKKKKIYTINKYYAYLYWIKTPCIRVYYTLPYRTATCL